MPLPPAILTVNPFPARRRKRHKVKNAMRHRRRHSRRRNPESARRRRAAAKAGWRARARRHNPVRRHKRRHNAMFATHRRSRRRRHRNPLSSVMSGGIAQDVFAAGIGAAGAIGADILVAYIPGIPAAFATGLGAAAVDAAASLLLGFGVGKVAGKRTGTMVAIGGLTVAAYTALKAVLAPTLGTSIKGLSGIADFQDFRAAPLGAYMNPAGLLPAPMPAPTASPAMKMAGIGAYMGRGRPAGMGM